MVGEFFFFFRRFAQFSPLILISFWAKVWYTECVTSRTITIRLRRSKAEIQANAKPNVNAWINQLIENALGPSKVDWNEHFESRRSARKFRLTGKVERGER
jgi:hypothetical protein